jgi:hypothetical protein
MCGQLLKLYAKSSAPCPAHDRSRNINGRGLPWPDLQMNGRVDRGDNRAPYPTASEGEVLHNTVFAQHRGVGKDPLEVDGIALMSALFHERAFRPIVFPNYRGPRVDGRANNSFSG